MRRLLVVAAVVVAALVAIAIAAVVRSGRDDDKTVQTVARHEITRDDVDLTVQHFHEEADREGRPFPRKGTKDYENVEKIALGLLIDRAAIEGAGAKLGVHVSDAQVDARVGAAGSGESEEGGAVRVKAEAAFARGTARTQLVEEGVSRKLTRAVTVSDAAVRTFYRAHRRLYGSIPFARLAEAIRMQLLAQRRNTVMADWLAKVRRSEPKPKL
jgi:hypothetical protein